MGTWMTVESTAVATSALLLEWPSFLSPSLSASPPHHHSLSLFPFDSCRHLLMAFSPFSVIFPTLIRVIFVSCNIDQAISFLFPTQYILWFAGTQRPKPMTLWDLILVYLSGLATLPPTPSLSHSALNLPLPSVIWGRCLSFPWGCASSSSLWPGTRLLVLQNEIQVPLPPP